MRPGERPALGASSPGSDRLPDAAGRRRHVDVADAVGTAERMDQRVPSYHRRKPIKGCCANCRATDLPNLKTLFPSVRTVTVDYMENERTRRCFQDLCRQITTTSDPQYLCFYGVGEAQLMGLDDGMPEIYFVDTRLRKIRNALIRLTSTDLYQDLEGPVGSDHVSAEVRELKRLSLRTTERLIRLLHYYDNDCNFLASASPTTVSARYVPDDLRADPETMSTEFLTAFNVRLATCLCDQELISCISVDFTNVLTVD